MKFENESEDEQEEFFDLRKWNVNEMVRIYMSHVHDPSKFWVRTVPVEPLHMKMLQVYAKNGDEYRIPRSEIRVGLNCVACISASCFCRCTILTFSKSCPETCKIFLYDLGSTRDVALSHLRYLDVSFSKIPKLILRASLANVSPPDNQMWKKEVVDKFRELINSSSLCAKIAYVDNKSKVLHFHIVDTMWVRENQMPTFNYYLVVNGFAKCSWHSADVWEPGDEGKKRSSTHEFPYLFPTFRLLEKGLFPNDVDLVERLDSIHCTH